MKEWKKEFEKLGYLQIEKNKFYNEQNSETVIFKNGLVFVKSKGRNAPIRQEILSACLGFIKENTYVKKKRELVGFLLKTGYFTVYERFELGEIYRIGEPEKFIRGQILSVVFFTDDDVLFFADKDGKIHRLEADGIETNTKIDPSEDYPKFNSRATFVGVLDKDGAAKDYFVIITKHNKIKKSAMSDYTSKSVNGIDLRDGDEIIFAAPANDDDLIFLLGDDGKLLKLSVGEYPEVERYGRGYKGFHLQKLVKSATIVPSDGFIISGGMDKAKVNKASDIPTGGRSTSGRVISQDPEFLSAAGEEVLVVNKDNRVALMKRIYIPEKNIKSKGVKIVSTNLRQIFG